LRLPKFGIKQISERGKRIMKLKILAISDTHLGEETSLLSYPIGVQHLWKVLRQTFSDNPEEKFDVEEMILLGDIPDRALASHHKLLFIQVL